MMKEASKRYNQTEKRKESVERAVKRYSQSERGKETRKRYSQSERGKEAIRRYSQSEKGKETKDQYQQSEKGKEALKRANQTIQRRITISLRTRIYCALKGINKSASTIKLLGCSIKDFLVHLESQFEFGMTFKNYGLWEIDHIKPCSKFDLTKPAQQRKCFHYTNLQPLWWKDNLSKGNKY